MQHEKKPVSNLKSMSIVGFEQTSTNFIEFLVILTTGFPGGTRNFAGWGWGGGGG